MTLTRDEEVSDEATVGDGVVADEADTDSPESSVDRSSVGATESSWEPSSRHAAVTQSVNLDVVVGAPAVPVLSCFIHAHTVTNSQRRQPSQPDPRSRFTNGGR